jgi:hypothetical protein
MSGKSVYRLSPRRGRRIGGRAIGILSPLATARLARIREGDGSGQAELQL